VKQSAGRCHHGRITKAGPSIARSLVVEATYREQEDVAMLNRNTPAAK
jgi:hypothetical protein